MPSGRVPPPADLPDPRAGAANKRKGFTETGYARFLEPPASSSAARLLVWDGLNTAPAARCAS